MTAPIIETTNLTKRFGPPARTRDAGFRRHWTGALSQDRHLLDRHEAAIETRASHRSRSGNCFPRRTDQRPRSQRAGANSRTCPESMEDARDMRRAVVAL